MTKNRITSFISAVLVLTLMASQAFALADTEFSLGIGANGGLTDRVEAYGARVSSRTLAGVQLSNNPQSGVAGRQYYTGKGILFDIEIATGASTTFVVCADTAATVQTDFTTMPVLLAPPMFSSSTNIKSLNGILGGKYTPTEFRVGLYCFSNVFSRFFPKWKPASE